MSDNSAGFSSLISFKNSIKKIAKKESDQSILNDDLNINQNKSLLLKKADLKLQNVLSSILINCNNEKKKTYNINDTLQQIQNIKRNIPVYQLSSCSDDSDISISPRTRKHNNSIAQTVKPSEGLLKKFCKSRYNLYKTNYKPNNNCNNNGNQYNWSNLDNISNLSSFKVLPEKNKTKPSTGFLYNQCERSKTIDEESIDNKNSHDKYRDIKRKNTTKSCKGLYIKPNSILNLDKIKEDISDNINLHSNKSRDSKKDVNLRKLEFAEDLKSFNDDNSIFTQSSASNCQSFTCCGNNNISPFRYLMKRGHRVYDSLSEDEEIIHDNYYIEPNHNFLFFFDTLLAVVSLLAFFHLPFAIGFIYHLTQLGLLYNFIFNTVIDLVYLIDLILSFFRGYYDFEEHFIFKNSDIYLNYLLGWFMIDFFATIPFNFLLDYVLLFYPNNILTQSTLQIYSNELYTMIHLFRLLRLLKIFKILFNNSFTKYLKIKYVDSLMESKWAQIKISFLLFFACVNLFGCVFIFLGYNHYPNWFELKHLEPNDVFGIYIASIYFILMTIVSIGYGDICVTNMTERVFNVLLLIFGIMLYSWAISALSNQMEDTSVKAIEYQQKLKLLEEIKLSHKALPAMLNKKIQKYLYSTYEHEQYNVEKILNQLPCMLRNALIHNMYRPIIENFTFFKNFSNDEFCVRVLMAFKPLVYVKNERIIHEGDYLDEMLFVRKGILSLELRIPSILNDEIEKTCSLTKAFSSGRGPINSDIKKVYSKFSMLSNLKILKEKPKQYITGYEEKYVKLLYIRKNEHFGDIMMFLNQRSPLSVRVKTKKAEVFLLKKTDAIDISMNYPKIWRRIIKKSIFNYEQINILIRKTLRFFFIQNRVCYNLLMKKYINYPRINSLASQYITLDPNCNVELASIPTLKSNQSSTENGDEIRSNTPNKEVQMKGMIKSEEDIENIKLTESSNANLVTRPNLINNSHYNEQNNDFVEKQKSNKIHLRPSTMLTDVTSKHRNIAFKASHGLIEERNKKSSKFFHERLDDSIHYDFSMINTRIKEEISHKNTIHDKLDEENINNELYENETLYSSNKYEDKSIDWDNQSEKKISKEIFNQKPDNEIQKQFISIPSFKSLKIDKGVPYEYNSNLVYYTLIQDPEIYNEEIKSVKHKDIKIAINIIPTNNEVKKDYIQLPRVKSSKLLNLNTTIHKGILNIYDNCLSFLPEPNNSINLIDSSRTIQQDHPENKTLEKIFTGSKYNTANIFKKKTKNRTIKDTLIKSTRRTSDGQNDNNTKRNNGNMKSNTSLLHVIGENIQNNSMNLNNPASFYTSTFASMIDMYKTKVDLLQINKKMNNLFSIIKNND